MNYWDKKLVREQLDKKLAKIRPILELPVPSGGWIKAIRESLGMTLNELGDKVGLSKSRISRIESAETTGEIKISTLENVAKGLGVKFVYGFVPEKDLEDMVSEQAKKIAQERLDRINHSMKLEEQGLNEEEQEKALNDLTEQILVEEPKNFWQE